MKKIYNDFKSIEKVLINSGYSVEDYKRILNKLEDEKSKLMFYYRVMFDNTNDAFYALSLEKTMYYQSTFKSYYDKLMFQYLEFLLNNNNYTKKIYIIGFSRETPEMSYWYTTTYFCHKIGELEVGCIFDNINESYYYNCVKSIEVNPLEKIYSYDFEPDSIFVIANPQFSYIRDYLVNNLNFSNESIFTFYEQHVCGRDLQYFCESFVKIGHDEIFVDGGAADFDTAFGFLQCVNWSYRQMYIIEPFEQFANICVEKINQYNLPNVVVENVGLWDENTTLNFSFEDNGASHVDNTSGNSVIVKSIDSILDGKEATIIKLDIEGSEYKALEGARNTIEKYNPILMVCVYHKKNDCINLSNLILSMYQDYKLFIRHYAFSTCETVMYFVPENKVNEI